MKRVISIVVSLAILIAIYVKIDFKQILRVFADADPLWLIASLAMVVPTIAFTSWRLKQMTPPQANLTFSEANKLVLAASVLNMVLPSKMGDIAKAYFIRDRGHLDGGQALALVVFEKTWDMLSLLVWCILGLLLLQRKDALFWGLTVTIIVGLVLGLMLIGSQSFAGAFFRLAAAVLPGKLRTKVTKLQTSWNYMHRFFWEDKKQQSKVVVMSLFIWYLHLLQIWMFIVALRAHVPMATSLGLTPLAILAGLLPLTFAGVGTRDAALIALYAPYFSAPIGAAVGLLCTSRYLLPAIGGIPYFQRYLAGAIGNAQTRGLGVKQTLAEEAAP